MITMKTKWIFEVDSAQTLLILKALGGRIKSPADVEAAKALGDDLTKARAVAAQNF